MKKARFTEIQIIGILKETDAEIPAKEIRRKYGMSDAICYNRKSKHRGMSTSDLKRLKEMERELSKLKRMFADMAMENRAWKDLIERNSPAAAGKAARAGLGRSEFRSLMPTDDF